MKNLQPSKWFITSYVGEQSIYIDIVNNAAFQPSLFHTHTELSLLTTVSNASPPPNVA